VRTEDQQVDWQSLRFSFDFLRSIARPDQDVYALPGRCEQWSTKLAHLLSHLGRISFDKHRNTSRDAFDWQWLRGMVNVEERELRRVPFGEH
jgi:hypothetical protein